MRRALKIARTTLAVAAAYAACHWLLNRPVPVPREELDGAAGEAVAYIRDNLSGDGRFRYLRPPLEPKDRGAYNVLRHAGTVYALSQEYRRSGDPETARSIALASGYLLEHHVRPVAGAGGALGVFSLPGEEVEGDVPVVKLGGCALGLVALAAAHGAAPGSVPEETLTGIGRGILFMQEDDGRFRSKYSESGGFDHAFDSLYYPGQAILALVELHEIDGGPRWLEAAFRSAGWLLRSREGIPDPDLPADHWLLIAIAELVEHDPGEFGSSVTRDALVAHARSIGNKIMRDQRLASVWLGTPGSFSHEGKTAPNATRLEGLVALRGIVAGDPELQGKIQRSIDRGTRFLLRARSSDPELEGGFVHSVGMLPWVSQAIRPSYRQVRIDYVQHALSAMLGAAAEKSP